MKLLAYFRSYMQENLIKAGGSVLPREGDELIRLPFLRQWFRTSRAVVMHLTNGTLQVILLYLNYLKDSTKYSPLGQLLSRSCQAHSVSFDGGRFCDR